jgi:hypothetical protein
MSCGKAPYSFTALLSASGNTPLKPSVYFDEMIYSICGFSILYADVSIEYSAAHTTAI